MVREAFTLQRSVISSMPLQWDECMLPQEIQDNLYSIPYHHLPWEQKGIWRLGRFLWWGYEYLALMEILLTIIRAYKPTRVLDFGCGDGRLLYELKKQMPETSVIGVDTSKRALGFAKAFLADQVKVHLYTNLSQVVQELLPVDVVVSMEVLEHIPPKQLPQVVEEIASVLRPDGIFIVTVPTSNIPVNPKHYQHFTLDTLMLHLNNYFDLIEYRYVHRVGWAEKLVRRMIINRLFIANSELWLRLATRMYQKLVLNASEKNGAHLVAVLRRTY